MPVYGAGDAGAAGGLNDEGETGNNRRLAALVVRLDGAEALSKGLEREFFVQGGFG